MELPVRLELQASRRLFWLLGALHGAALGGVLPLTLSPWLKLAAAAVVAASALAAIRRHALLAVPDAVRELSLGGDGSVLARRQDGSELAASVAPGSTGFAWLVVLLLAVPGGGRPLSVVVLPDALPAAQFRALRSWLRWVAGQGAENR